MKERNKTKITIEPNKAFREVRDNSLKNIHNHSDSYMGDTKSIGEEI